MTTIKSPLACANSLRCFSPVRLSSPLSTNQPILPDIVSSTVSQKHRTKKCVRFALQLEPAEENSSLPPDHENCIVLTTKPSKRVIDPWREDGPLYGAYIEYLERKDALTPETCKTNQPLSSELEVEPSTYTHTFVLERKSSEALIDSIRGSTPSRHLPRLANRIIPTKKGNRKSSSPIVDPYLKQRANVSTPPRYLQPRKTPNSPNNKNRLNSINSAAKRADLALPSIKSLNSNDKVIRTDYSLGKKLVNEYFQSKTLTEIITNPLPGTNNQINYISGHAILPNLSKTPEISCNNESYFFQNHNNDHFQPIIHSTN